MGLLIQPGGGSRDQRALCPTMNNPCWQLVVCVCHPGVSAFQGDFKVWFNSAEQLNYQGVLHAGLKLTSYLREKGKRLLQGQSCIL